MKINNFKPTAAEDFDVALGDYLVEFVGVVDKKPFEESAYGDTGPRLGWRFKVIGPAGSPMLGKTIEQNTSTKMSQKSGMVRIMNMLEGGLGIKEGADVDTDAWVGRRYEVRWAPNPDSPKKNPHIERMVPVGGGPNRQPETPFTQAPTRQAAPARPAGPPPRKAAPAEEEWWVDLGEAAGDPVLKARAEVQAMIDAGQITCEALCIARGGVDDAPWQAPSECGFATSVPF